VLQTVDFVHPSGQCLFRTCKEEKDKVVFQLVSIHGTLMISRNSYVYSSSLIFNVPFVYRALQILNGL
jgi:hypothetical protein